MKISFKIIVLLVLILSIMTSVATTYVNASYSNEVLADLSNVDKGEANESGATKSARTVVQTIISITRVIGVTVAVVMLLVVAMKYMVAAPGERADIKKHSVVYVVGAIVLFAVTGILSIIYKFSENISAS